MKTPKVLLELVEDLKLANFTANASVAGEGRHGSLKDEEMIINWLLAHKKWGNKVQETQARRFGDIIVDGIYYINIKTDEFSKNPRPSSGTNSFSTCGFAYALSDASVEDIGGRMNYTKLTNLINVTTEDNERDYWYLAFNKLNMNQVFIRGAKQINHYASNPKNMLQVNFGWEYVNKPVERTYDEAKEFIIDKIKECIKKRLKDDMYLLNNL